MRRALAIFVTGLVAGIVAVVAPVSSAQAYVLWTCKFAQGAPLYVERAANTYGWYWDRSKEAFARWNSTNTPTSFGVTTDRPGNVVISSFAFADPTVYAETSGRCSGGVWSGHTVNIRWSIGLYDELTYAQGRLVGTHEFGHALGLDHTNPSCTGTKSVMVQGPKKWTCGWGLEPWADDIAGVHYLY
ncbi:matrixin family metalloprotease [Actinoplanes sp. NPDC000266]